MKKIFFAVILFSIFLGLAFYIFNRQAIFSHGSESGTQTFEVKPGEGVTEIARRLARDNLIQNAYYFDYYVWKTKSRGKIQAGGYELNGQMTVPEIVAILTVGKIISNETKVTFPEGSSLQQMSDILKEKGFDGDEFLRVAKCACGVKTNYDFLKNRPDKSTLEGFLFPDTYIFRKDASAADVVNRMLENFDEKLTQSMRAKTFSDNRNIFQIVTLASILEKEAKTLEDMKLASGIFWRRIAAGMPLQSCATVAYVLGKDKKQFSFDDTRTPSPYNTYLNKGLPPGPITNPGMNAIQAAIYPTASDYNFFLTDPNTGQMLYAKTLAEHEANKQKCGL